MPPNLSFLSLLACLLALWLPRLAKTSEVGKEVVVIGLKLFLPISSRLAFFLLLPFKDYSRTLAWSNAFKRFDDTSQWTIFAAIHTPYFSPPLAEEMDESLTADIIDDSKVSDEPPLRLCSTGAQLTPEELVAKSIAPVKREYLRPPPARSSCNNVKDDVLGDKKRDNKATQSSLAKEKKSKRQLKRERQEDQKSSKYLCPVIAKTGDVSSCRYNDKCRFSHDIEAFKSQKPADLHGECPFNGGEQLCPYGLACRFSGTHKEGVSASSSNASRKCSEMNGLSKDIQKLLWKNKLKFPKSESRLKELGLSGSFKSKVRVNLDKEDSQTVSNGCVVSDNNCCGVENGNLELDANLEISVEIPEENGLEGSILSDESRILKKPKSVISADCLSDQINSGAGECITEKPFSETESCTHIEPEHSNCSAIETDGSLKQHQREKKLIDFRDKLYLAPLTTVGNLPFRRVCKVLGADVTCGEMAMCTNLLQGQASEWALLRRHSSEDLFGVQICGAYPDTVTRAVELIDKECVLDFIDINMGCPIDIVVNKGAGSALLTKPMRMKSVVEATSGIVDTPITIKVRTAYFEGKNRIDSLIADIGNWGASAVTIHGRSRQQRYSKLADWEYIYKCSTMAPDSLQVIGNGDVFSYLDWYRHKDECSELTTCMIARGALIKPWIFTEIKEQRNWDITSGERLNILKDFTHFGLEHWGSDTKGVETTRHFLLEWLSYTCRYIPVGLLDVVPQRLNWRPPSYFGRDDLETLMASDSAADWVRISEMLLGKVPEGFSFSPKHKSNAYDSAENG